METVIEFKQILCPTDLSEASRRSLTYAAAFAHWYQSRLTVLHVVPTFEPITVGPGALTGPPQMVLPMSREEVLVEMRRITDSAVGCFRSGALVTSRRISCHLEPPDPGRVIFRQRHATFRIDTPGSL